MTLNVPLARNGEALPQQNRSIFRDPTELSRMSQMLAAFIGGNLPSLAPVEADEEEEEDDEDDDEADDEDDDEDEDEDDDEDDDDDEEEEESEPG